MKKVPYGKRSKLKIIVVRKNKSGDLANSKPCKMCLEFIRHAGIKTVYYSDSNGNIVKNKSNNISMDDSCISSGTKLIERIDKHYLRTKIRKIKRRMSRGKS